MFDFFLAKQKIVYHEIIREKLRPDNNDAENCEIIIVICNQVKYVRQ